MKKYWRLLALTCSFLLCSWGYAADSAQPKFVAYWQNYGNSATQAMRLTDIPPGYNVINIAFADLASDGTVSFTLQGPPYASSDLAKFKSDIATLQNQGVKVLLVLGGQNGFYSVNDDAANARFEASLESIIESLGVDGVDYDFESGLSTGNSGLLVSATQKIKSDFAAKGKDLLFTMAPETIDVYFQIFPNGKYDKLIQSGLINWVQVQMYNSGCMPGINPGSACYVEGTEDFAVSQADSTLKAWGGVLSEENYVLGFPATTNAAGGGYDDPAIIKKALQCLRTGEQCGSYVPTQKYPNIGGVMTWDVNWDATSGYAFENSLSACVLQGNCQ